MQKSFDYEKYLKVLQSFIVALDALKSDRVDVLSSIIAPVAEFLSLGRIELVAYSDAIAEEQNAGHNYVLYNGEKYSVENPYSAREIIGSGGIAYYSLYPTWNVLKLDKSFIDPNPDEESDKKAKIMFKNIISMAQEMGMTCLTEGVETEEQVQYLKDNNCFMAQGFFFDKPLPVEEFEKKLERVQ